MKNNIITYTVGYVFICILWLKGLGEMGYPLFDQQPLVDNLFAVFRYFFYFVSIPAHLLIAFGLFLVGKNIKEGNTELALKHFNEDSIKHTWKNTIQLLIGSSTMIMVLTTISGYNFFVSMYVLAWALGVFSHLWSMYYLKPVYIEYKGEQNA